MNKHVYRLAMGSAYLALLTIVVWLVGLAALSVTPYITHLDVQWIGIIAALIIGVYIMGWIYE